MSGSQSLGEIQQELVILRIMLQNLTDNVSQNQSVLVANQAQILQELQQSCSGMPDEFQTVIGLLTTITSNQTSATSVLQEILTAIKLLPKSPVAIELDTEHVTRKPQPVPGRQGP